VESSHYEYCDFHDLDVAGADVHDVDEFDVEKVWACSFACQID